VTELFTDCIALRAAVIGIDGTFVSREIKLRIITCGLLSNSAFGMTKKIGTAGRRCHQRGADLVGRGLSGTKSWLSAIAAGYRLRPVDQSRMLAVGRALFLRGTSACARVGCAGFPRFLG